MLLLTCDAPDYIGCVAKRRVWMQVMVGLVLRDHLMVLLRRCLAAGGTAAMANEPVPYEELSRHVVTAAARSYVSEQQMAVLQVLPMSLPWLPLVNVAQICSCWQSEADHCQQAA